MSVCLVHTISFSVILFPVFHFSVSLLLFASYFSLQVSVCPFLVASCLDLFLVVSYLDLSAPHHLLISTNLSLIVSYFGLSASFRVSVVFSRPFVSRSIPPPLRWEVRWWPAGLSLTVRHERSLLAVTAARSLMCATKEYRNEVTRQQCYTIAASKKRFSSYSLWLHQVAIICVWNDNLFSNVTLDFSNKHSEKLWQQDLSAVAATTKTAAEAAATAAVWWAAGRRTGAEWVTGPILILSSQHFVRISHFIPACYILYRFHPPVLGHLNNISIKDMTYESPAWSLVTLLLYGPNTWQYHAQENNNICTKVVSRPYTTQLCTVYHDKRITGPIWRKWSWPTWCTLDTKYEWRQRRCEWGAYPLHITSVQIIAASQSN